MAGKRIVFTNATPNDQGGVIPNSALDFSRFKKNPVVLCQHAWGDLPLGMWSDIQYDSKADEWTGIPLFHRLTPESITYSDLYEGGWIKASSIGGDAEWKTNNAGQMEYDAQGNRVCEKFVLYEISIVTIPSNPDAVTKEQLAAKCYEKAEIEQMTTTLVTLSSKYKSLMDPKDQKNKDKTPEQLRLEAAEKELADAKAAADAVAAAKLGANGGTGNNSNDPSMGQLPGVVREIVRHNESVTDKVLNFLGAALGVKAIAKNEGAPPPKGEPESKIEDLTISQPTPTGLTAKQEAAKKKAEEARQAAEKAAKDCEAAKAVAEKEGASKEEKDGYAAKFAAMEAAVHAAHEADEEYKSCMNESEEMNAGAKPGATGLAAGQTQAATTAAPGAAPAAVKPKLLTVEELQAQAVKLAPKPEHRAKVGKFNGVPFSVLTSDKNEEGQRILGRVMTNSEEKNISDYQVILESLLIDDKYKAIVEKTRVITTSDVGYRDYRKHDGSLTHVKNRPGTDLRQLAAKFNRGMVDVMDSGGILRETMTLGAKTREKFGSTADLLASPDLFTVEWLTLAIFTLYPATDWKADIGMFQAEMTSKNTGLILANVAADPAVYFGNQPVNPADYQVDDVPVAVTLVPSWLQPMVWNPLTLHQLRYDKMAVQWAQAFAKWGALMDDKLIYILLSLIPAASLVTAGGQAANPSFTLTGANDPNSFAYNPNLVGTYATPAWADIIRLEQIYAKQNYNLDTEKIILVTDPTADRYIATDNDTKSLLTRFTTSNPEELLKIKHTKLVGRSRIGAYDTVSKQIKDPTGVLPATVVSAMLSFVASQVALALGILDVFMIQDPSVYGYRMSADIRQGSTLIRENGNGAAVYTYGLPVNP